MCAQDKHTMHGVVTSKGVEALSLFCQDPLPVCAGPKQFTRNGVL